MAQKLLSISLGSEIVKVCEISLAGKNKVQVYNAIDLLIPEGLCDDGMIINPTALASAIKEGLAGEGFSARKIIFSLSSKRIANKEALIPFCKPNRIKDIVAVNATEYFPIANLDNYTINYSIIEVVATDTIKNYRLSITATPNELIEQYYALAKAMGMGVETMDYSGNSILQLLKLQTAGDSVDAILQFSGENTVVNIMNGSTMIMQRSVPYGRAAICDAVRAFKDCSTDEADEILVTEDIEHLVNISEEVADAVRALLSSINRILEFYRNKNPEQPIDHIYLIGDVTSVNGLADLIIVEMGGNVEVIESLRGVEIKKRSTVNEQIASNYLANIGAVLAPMDIRFSQDKKGTKSGKGALPWWLLIFSFVVSLGMVGAIYFLYLNAKSDNEDLHNQIDAYGNMVSLEGEYTQAQADYQTMTAWYETTKGANESLAKLFKDLERIQPKAVAITKISSLSGAVNIEGSSYGKPAIAEFVIQLKELPYVEDVKMDVINEVIKDVSAVDSFNLNLSLKYDDPYSDIDGESDYNTASDSVSDDYVDQTIYSDDNEPLGITSDENVESSEGGEQ